MTKCIHEKVLKDIVRYLYPSTNGIINTIKIKPKLFRCIH